MALIRVHELAKELGTTSMDVLACLKAHGEFVRSASTALMPQVERMVRAEFGTSPAPTSERPQPPARQAHPRHEAPVVRRPTGPRPGGNPLTPPMPALGRARNPFMSGQGMPRPRPARSAGPAGRRARRSEVSDVTRAQVEAIFGIEAARQVLGPDFRAGATFDGYDHRWQERLIDRDTYEAFQRAGLGPGDDALAEEILLAGLEPSDLLWRIGEETVLTWIARRRPVAQLAKTLLECRANPADRHLVSAPEPWEVR